MHIRKTFISSSVQNTCRHIYVYSINVIDLENKTCNEEEKEREQF